MSRITGLTLAFLLVSPATGQASAPDAETFFELKIRPTLAGTCFKCHGGTKISNDLRVDSRDGLLKGGENGPAIVPGEPDKSLLIQAIRYSDEELRMPPAKRLADEVVADFVTWVKQGANWPKAAPFEAASKPHWAFEPVNQLIQPPPATGWSDHPIDRFIAAKWGGQGLKPVATADKRTLIRRVYFDLTGLPPTPEELAAALADDSVDAFAKLVDRLLGSPRYGERWGRYWMDVARYADTAGDNADYPVPEARLYRDYIIDSFNADKPYNEFVEEQLAGDIVAKQGPPEKYAERVVATGFLALSRRYATGPYELWPLTIEDTIETTGRAFMGLTLRCARCHDHKFDPITTKDYYALYGIFESTQYPWAGAEEFNSKKLTRMHFVPLVPPAEAAPRLAAFQRQTHDLEAEIEHAEKEGPLAKRSAWLKAQSDVLPKQVQTAAASPGSDFINAGFNRIVSGVEGYVRWFGYALHPPQVRLCFDASFWNRAEQARLAELEKQLKETNRRLEQKLAPMRDRLRQLGLRGLPADLPGAYAVADGKPTDAFVQIRGEISQPGATVKRNVPKFLTVSGSVAIRDGASGRLELARWLTRPEHPLTARVMVNRIWQYHFGKGLVGTPSNFGLRGEEPTHLELLDWLTARFVESGWSMKAMHRLILSSRTYQLSSNHDESNAAKDPANRWYSRYDRRRLDAEAIRDAMLAVSGKLDLARPGDHPFPPIEKWVWTQHSPFKDVYPSNHRSVYLMTQRFQRHPFLALFDGPDTNTTTDVRSSSNVPLQALFMMNSPFVREQAEGLARRLIEASSEPRRRIELAHRLAWSRPPQPAEHERALRYVDAYTKQLAQAGPPSDHLELETWTSFARIVLTASEFVYTD